MKRLGFYGGSFNPPHAGHQATILHAISTGNLDELLIVPVYKHPYGKNLEDYYKRMQMCHYLTAPFDSRYCPIGLSYVEKNAWEDGGKGLTSEAIHMMIHEEYKHKGERPHIVLILGSDCRDDLPKWEGYDQLMELCKRGLLSFFFVERLPGLSSTAVRNAIKAGGVVDRWLPKDVHQYVFKNNLYR
jgi:nicotinate-nucleotide adenylyltransferase